MPIKITNEGWVKVPPPKVRRKPKPIDPVDVLRGPLAYITGRPEFKEPAKKQSYKQLMIEAASIPAPPPPPEQLIFDDKPQRSHRSRRRVESTPTSLSKLSRAIEEADEDIPRPDLYQEEVQSRRSASPIGLRHARVKPTTRSRRHHSHSAPTRDEQNEDHRHSKRGQSSHAKHYSSSRSVYYDDNGDDYNRHHRSSRSERSYREREDYYSHPHHRYNFPPHQAPTPTLQPIIIYSTPPPQQSGCGSHHHGCSSHHVHSCMPPPSRRMIEPTAPVPEPVAETTIPSAPPSVVSSSSSRSRQTSSTRPMSYKWYTATQPLIL